MEKYLIAEFDLQAREPIIRRMRDNSLICTFLCGEKEPQNDNYVGVSRSYDDGETWSEPKILFSHSSRGVWCTEIFNDGEFPLAAIHTYNADNIYLELNTYWSESRDNGITWSEPKSFNGCLNGCSIRQGITLSNGDILFPLYWQNSGENFDWTSKGVGNYMFLSGVGILPKDENCWYRYGCITEKNLSFWEPNAVELEDGHIIMYLRNNSGFLYYSESFDYGRNWSKAKKTDIPHSDAKITCLKIKNKVILLNNAIASGRTHLEISVSDDGLNFKQIRYVTGADDNYFYPHAFAEDDKQTLYVAFENMKQHYLVKFSYDELNL